MDFTFEKVSKRSGILKEDILSRELPNRRSIHDDITILLIDLHNQGGKK